jgi:hypothetical protein
MIRESAKGHACVRKHWPGLRSDMRTPMPPVGASVSRARTPVNDQNRFRNDRHAARGWTSGRDETLCADEVRDLRFKIAGQVIVLKQNTVLEGLAPALDLALGLRMATRGANVRHAAILEPFGEIARDVMNRPGFAGGSNS